MPRKKGYRVDRLRRRRRTRVGAWQAAIVYVFAGVVAFAAVLGAWQVAAMLTGDKATVPKAGYLSLVTIDGPSGSPESAALVARNAADGSYGVYVIPTDLLLMGPNGEYVFAGDSLREGTLKQDLERVVEAKIGTTFRLPARALSDIAGAPALALTLPRPVTLTVGGEERVYKNKASVPAGDIPALMSATGPSGYDAASMQEAIWRAALQAAALRPEKTRAGIPGKVAALLPDGADGAYLRDALHGLLATTPVVSRVPATARVAEGQFAFVPDPEGITATITRAVPGYKGVATVLVRNGSGKVGIGEAVRRRLAVLPVDLPAPANADNFGYTKTQILAGSGAVQVAQNVRAILGHGVVLGAADLPADQIVVIVGRDVDAKDLETKDQP